MSSAGRVVVPMLFVCTRIRCVAASKMNKQGDLPSACLEGHLTHALCARGGLGLLPENFLKSRPWKIVTANF